MMWEDGQKENYTHVIARNSQKPLAVWARDNGKTIVSLLWVWDCLEAGRLLPVEEEQVCGLLAHIVMLAFAVDLACARKSHECKTNTMMLACCYPALLAGFQDPACSQHAR